MSSTWEQLGEALKRFAEFKGNNFRQADPATRVRMLAAWKEHIIADCIAALRGTNDVELIGSLDCRIASILDAINLTPSARPSDDSFRHESRNCFHNP
jgi:hypothetical protein